MSALPSLAVITPVSRPWLLPKVAASLVFLEPWVNYQWFPIIDTKGADVSGGRKRNVGIDAALSWRRDIWIYQLDDDNVISPGFAGAFITALRKQPTVDIVLFPNILLHNGSRHGTDGLRHLDHVVQGRVDTAQYVVRAAFAGDLRYELVYASDYIYLKALADRAPKPSVAVAEDAFVYYNALREQSEP